MSDLDELNQPITLSNENLNEYKGQNITKTKKSKSDFIVDETANIVFVTVFLGVLYLGSLVVYLWLCHSSFYFKLFYPNLLTETPGGLIDQRLDIFWWFLLFNLLHLFIPHLLMLTANNLRRTLVIYLTIIILLILILVDITEIFLIIFYWIFYNNTYIPILNPADDPEICSAYFNVLSFCPLNSYTGKDPSTLHFNQNYLIFTIVFALFVILDVLTLGILIPLIIQTNDRIFIYDIKN